MVAVPLLLTGVALLGASVAAIAYALLGMSVPRISKQRRRGSAAPPEPLGKRAYRAFVDGMDVLLRQRGWMPFRASQLEEASITKPASVVLTWILIGSVAGFLIGLLVMGGLAMGVVLALVPPLVARVVLKARTAARRRRFESQLDPTLRILASALRAGQSLTMAVSSVAADAESPMSDELARIVTENRVGRDLVQAMLESADRMQSEDFRWFAEAVEIQRDTGGNLNDIIDVVAETIRDRAEIREKINAYASEGKASMWVLMALPIALGLAYMVMRPGYMDLLFVSGIGRVLLVASVLLYGAGYLWMRKIVDIKV